MMSGEPTAAAVAVLCTDDERTIGGFTLDEWKRAFELGGTPRNQAYATGGSHVRAPSGGESAW